MMKSRPVGLLPSVPTHKFTAAAQQRKVHLTYCALLLLVLVAWWSSSQPRDNAKQQLQLSTADSRQQQRGAALATTTGAWDHTCTKDEAHVQSILFRAVHKGEGLTTITWCPPFHYLLDVAAVVTQPAAKDLIMWDIGCNKGYDTAMSFELWRPSSGLSRKTLGEFVTAARKTQDPDAGIGVCSDAKATFGEAYKSYTPPEPTRTGGLKVHCFEPSKLNYELLTQAQAHFFGDHKPQDERERLQVHRLAFSNSTGTTSFTANCKTEQCHITAGGGDVVNMTTVDAMMEQLGTEELFLLKIDTEGFDPLVLKGAQKTLAAHKVALVQFEYHAIGMWAHHSLKQMTDWLDTLGYVCYFEGSLLTQITACWDPDLEVRRWSNIVCAVRGSPVHRVLSAYSIVPFETRYQKLKSLG